MENSFDVIIIGAGPGGYVAAIRAAQLGLSTAVIESEDIGGTCLNRGCIPTKAMLHASSLLREIRESERFGISVKDVDIDYGKLTDYRKDSVEKLVRGVAQLLKANGVTLIKGRGLLTADKTVQITRGPEVSSYKAENIILASGSVPFRLPVSGMELSEVLTSDGIFALDHLPESLAIIGGGVIGVEFAEVFSSLGCKVTIIEAMPKLLPNMDKEISQSLKLILKKRGVDIHTSSVLEKIDKKDGSCEILFKEKDKECSVSSQYVLCAVGRKPNTENLFSEDVNIKKDRGFIKTGEDLMTDEDGVYAVGDIIKGPQLAHVASAQGIYAAELIAKRMGKNTDENDEADTEEKISQSHDLSVIPSCIYTDPEIASAGMTEDDAKKAGIPVKTGKFIMSANGKSIISMEERGFIKVIAHGENDRILGVQMMCARATDMIGEAVTAITNGLTADQLMKGMRPHPTYNEGLMEALEDIDGKAVHTLPKKRK